VRSIVVTSTEPNEGKTTIASNLAISFATMGDRVLLVDAEVRRAGMHAIFNVPERPGLTDLIAARSAHTRAAAAVGAVTPRVHRLLPDDRALATGEPPGAADAPLAVSAAIHAAAIANLFVLPGGTPSESPADTLAAHVAEVQGILDEVRSQFDVIVVDSPPLALVHDTAILSRLVDGVVFVVNSRRIDRELLDRSGRVLERAGARVLGAILNQVDPVGIYRKNSYYYRQGSRPPE